MNQYNIEVDILVDGKSVRRYPHQNRTFIPSKHRTEYTIRIRNRGLQRRLFVVTVDGLNVVDGNMGAESKAGYVINGYNTYEVKGYRTSNEVVHPFKFNRKGRSYAAKSDVTEGDTRNCGIIGVQVYCEKEILQCQTLINPVPYPYQQYYRWGSQLYEPVVTYGSLSSSNSSTNNSEVLRGISNTSPNTVNACMNTAQNTVHACSTSQLAGWNSEQPIGGFDTGTEFSEQEVTDRVVDVDFLIGHSLCTIDIYYATYEALKEMGVPVTRQAQVAFPESFPARFCRPPNDSRHKKCLCSG